MSNIQGNLNQLLTLAAAGYRMSSAYELAGIKSNIKGLKKQTEAIAQKTGMVSPAEAKELEAVGKNIVSQSRKRFNVEPTKENWEKHISNVNAAVEQKQRLKDIYKPIITPADTDEILQEQAELKAQKSLEREQKRVGDSKRKNFVRDYLSKQPTSLEGFNVADLPKNMQQHIAKQYSPSEKKKLLKTVEPNKENV